VLLYLYQNYDIIRTPTQKILEVVITKLKIARGSLLVNCRVTKEQVTTEERCLPVNPSDSYHTANLQDA